MAGEGKAAGERIRSLKERLNLSTDDLILYSKGSRLLSHTASNKILDTIPQETKDKIKQFYETLKLWDIYDYNPETNKIRVLSTTLQTWKDLLKSRGEPEYQNITEQEISILLDTSIQSAKDRMGIKDKSYPKNSVFYKSLKQIPKEVIK